jgi:quercetin dioxygenase-like cupin family protein
VSGSWAPVRSASTIRSFAIESGEANSSLALLVKVAGELGVPVDELLAAPRAEVRKWTAEEVGSRQRGQGIAERPLVPEPLPDGMLNVMDFAPGARLRGTPHLPGTREYFTCLEGRVGIVVAGHRHDLEAGDVLAFPGNIPHSYHNPDAKPPARGVSVGILAKAGSEAVPVPIVLVDHHVVSTPSRTLEISTYGRTRKAARLTRAQKRRFCREIVSRSDA